MKIIDMAVHSVATIPSGSSVLECAKRMRQDHVGSLVVVDENNKPVGLITDRDITLEVVALEKSVDGLIVNDVMSSPVCVAHCTEGVVDALARMREQGIRRLPVVDEDGVLCGIVTASNIVEELSVLLDSIVRSVKSSKTREIALRP
jgi:CBS-domain-containing membrane protein